MNTIIDLSDESERNNQARTISLQEVRPDYEGSGGFYVPQPKPDLPLFPGPKMLVLDEGNTHLLASLLPALDRYDCLTSPIRKGRRSPWVRAHCDLYHDSGPWGAFKFRKVPSLKQRYNFKHKVGSIHKYLTQYRGSSEVHRELLNKLNDYRSKEKYYEDFMAACKEIVAQEIKKPEHERVAIPKDVVEIGTTDKVPEKSPIPVDDTHTSPARDKNVNMNIKDNAPPVVTNNNVKVDDGAILVVAKNNAKVDDATKAVFGHKNDSVTNHNMKVDDAITTAHDDTVVDNNAQVDKATAPLIEVDDATTPAFHLEMDDAITPEFHHEVDDVTTPTFHREVDGTTTPAFVQENDIATSNIVGKDGNATPLSANSNMKVDDAIMAASGEGNDSATSDNVKADSKVDAATKDVSVQERKRDVEGVGRQEQPPKRQRIDDKEHEDEDDDTLTKIHQSIKEKREKLVELLKGRQDIHQNGAANDTISAKIRLKIDKLDEKLMEMILGNDSDEEGYSVTI